MSLRRFAQQNAAASPARTSSSASSSTDTSPLLPTTPVRSTPTTPRTRLVYPISPVTSPSRSASVPFDWEAARSRRPPPYATPQRVRALRKSEAGIASPAVKGSPSKRVVRKMSLKERITSIPSRIAFEISLFPNNVPLPAPTTSAYIMGGLSHFTHLCVCIAQIRRVPDTDLGWEDMYHEGEGNSWFNWTIPAVIVLFAVAILNTCYLFTRTRVYQLSMANDPVSSPHAAFVEKPKIVRSISDDDFGPKKSIWARIGSMLSSVFWTLWSALVVSMRFLFNLSPPKSHRVSTHRDPAERVQQLEVWTPGELENMLFSVYSPVHALLWTAVTSANWMRMFIIMGILSVQLKAMIRAYEALVKDRAIIASEVLHEYDEKFVYPRVNPVRKDAAVMTHQAEMFDYRQTTEHEHN